MSEDLLVLNAEQLQCIASPLRSELLEVAIRLSRFSVNELAAKIERKPKALYPHVRQMVEAGLLKQVDERLSAKRMEAIYAPVSRRIQMPRDNFDPEYRSAVRKKLRAVVRQVEREHIRYLESVENEDRSFSLRLFLKLTPQRIVELKRKLIEVGEWARSFENEESTIEVAATFLTVPLVSSRND